MSEDTPRTDAKEIDVSSSTVKVLTKYVRADFARELERENNELRELVNIITAQEMSDSGRIFYPTSIDSCRCLDLERIGQITEKYRKTPHITTDDYDES